MPGLTGTRLGRYIIQERLGRGGMSEVYLAYDESMHRNVAIKVVSSSHADYMERFHREAEAIGRLDHAHILPAYDYGEQEPWHYMVMPFIELGTLRDRLLEGPLSLEEVGILFEQVASALQFAHDQGIIHRDIKPSNILLRDDHYAYLSDFGLAKSVEGGSTITQTGNLLGTPEYMAPELSEGPATTSSDLYALGILLYQMVVGQVPFSGETPIAVYWKQIRDEPPPPSQINPAIPRSIERVILRALEKQPGRRYQTANELAQAYINALTFPDQIEEEEIAISSSLHETMPWEVGQERLARPGAPFHTSVQEGRLVLPNSPVAAPSAIPSQRRRFARRAVPNIVRRRSGRLAPPTPHPLETLTPTAMRDFVPAQPENQAAQAQPYSPRRRRPASTRRNRRNPVLISLIVMGFLLLAVFLIAIPFTYLANKTNTQLATATANANVRATQQAKATAGVASTATSGTLILSDTLASNTNGRWVENTTCVFTGGSYHVKVQQTSFLQICPSNTLSLDDAAIQVDVSLLSGNDAGLLFRANGAQYYDFEITDQGQFFLRRHNAGTGASYTYLIENTSSPVIASPGKKNRLLIIANGDDFKLFINGTFMGEAHDTTFASGQVALVAGTLYTTNNGEGSFANLKVFKS
jgi:serine/threonine protein kinase